MPTTANNETLERIKNEVAIEWFDRNVPNYHPKSWSNLIKVDQLQCWPIVCERYARAVALASLKEQKEPEKFDPFLVCGPDIEGKRKRSRDKLRKGIQAKINSEPILDAIHSDTEETQSARNFINSQDPPIHVTSKELNKPEPWDKVMTDRVTDILKPEPVSSETQEELWKELIDIYDTTDRHHYGYGGLINNLSKRFTITRNPLKP